MSEHEIADLARRLANVLDDAERGTSSWHVARERLGRQLYAALGGVLADEPAPVDWPARFRKAADVAESMDPMEADGNLGIAVLMRNLAERIADVPPHVVEAIGRALLGEAP